MKAQITRGMESLHSFSLLFPSTLQTLIYFSLLPFHFIVLPGSKVVFFSPICIAAATWNDWSASFHHSNMFLYFNSKPFSTTDFLLFKLLLFRTLQGKKKTQNFNHKEEQGETTFCSQSQLSRNLATMVSGICCLRIHFYICNGDEYLKFIWGEAIPFSRNSGNLLTNTWKYCGEGTEINLSGCCRRCLKAACILC